VAEDEDLLARFLEEARKVGMQPRVLRETDLCQELAALLQELGCRSASLSMSDGKDAEQVRRALKATDCEQIDWRSKPGIDAQYDVDVGITDVCMALAESGSLILTADRERSRGAHLAPPIHIAILRREQILPDLVDYLPMLDAEKMPVAQVLITGPSKTADIEGVLVTGVHGPGSVYVFLLDG